MCKMSFTFVPLQAGGAAQRAGHTDSTARQAGSQAGDAAHQAGGQAGSAAQQTGQQAGSAAQQAGSQAGSAAQQAGQQAGSQVSRSVHCCWWNEFVSKLMQDSPCCTATGPHSTKCRWSCC